MASLFGTGSDKRIEFTNPVTNKRHTIRLSKLSLKQAKTFQARLEDLINSKTAGTAYDEETAKWLATVDQKILDRLVEIGLAKQREDASNPALLEFLDSYIKSRTDVSSRTRLNYLQAKGFIEGYLEHLQSKGEVSDKQTFKLNSFTLHHGKQFRVWMLTQHNFRQNKEPHSENYIRTQCKNCRLFFGAAVDAKKIEVNPFKDKSIPCRVQAVPERMRFISAEDTAKILEQCPNIEWRLVISLARWGGLRIPSEITEFKWEQVDWQNNRITVPQPKLKRFEGKKQRTFPLFPELVPVLREAWENAEDGSVYVLPSLRGDAKNLRTTFLRIIRSAGLTPWGKPFQNLRSTRATELGDQFPIKVVSEWLGHDPSIALSNYHQVTQEHWDRAVSPKAKTEIIQNTGANTSPTKLDLS